MKLLLGVVIGVCSVVALGCGDTDDGRNCGDTSACGGDIAGSWKVTSSCLTSDATAMADMGCEGIKSDVRSLSASGTVAFNGDMTYQQSLTLSGVVGVTVPASCLTQSGLTLTCAQLQQSLEANAAGRGYESVACSGSKGCDCTMNLIPQTAASAGTYSTSGGTLTQTEDGGAPEEGSYCVKGSTLTLSPSDAGISGSVVLTKQ